VGNGANAANGGHDTDQYNKGCNAWDQKSIEAFFH
jgi:hypothetical protein